MEMRNVGCVLFALFIHATTIISSQQVSVENAVCRLQNDSGLQQNFELQLATGKLFIYVCKKDESLPNVAMNHCEQLKCNVQGVFARGASLMPRIGPDISEEKTAESNLPQTRILTATILALAFVVSAMGLFIWVRRTRRANVCWAHASKSPTHSHSELSVTDDNQLDAIEEGLYEDVENVDTTSPPPLPPSRVIAHINSSGTMTASVEMRDNNNTQSVSRDLRQESIAEED